MSPEFWELLTQTLATVGPQTGAMLLVFGGMVWLASRRGVKRKGDIVVLLSGAFIIVALTVSLFLPLI